MHYSYTFSTNVFVLMLVNANTLSVTNGNVLRKYYNALLTCVWWIDAHKFYFLNLSKTIQHTLNYELRPVKQNKIKCFMPNNTWITG